MKPYLKLHSVNGKERSRVIEDYSKMVRILKRILADITIAVRVYTGLDLKDTELWKDLLALHYNTRFIIKKHEVDDGE